MKWDQVAKAACAAILADHILVRVYGTHVRMLGTGQHLVPVLEYSVIGDVEDELWNACTLQWDQWCLDMDALRTSERQLRRLFHQDVPVTLSGLSMWMQYVDSDQLTAPDRDDYHGRAIRFRYTPLRERYAPVASL